MSAIQPFLQVSIVLALLATTVSAEVVQEKHANGKVKLRYNQDKNGLKQGAYEEFFENGKSRIKAQYRKDKLFGPYTERDENGNLILTAKYKDGNLDGELTRYDAGVTVITQTFKGGEPNYSRSLEELTKTLAKIDPPAETIASDDLDAERQAALRRLKAYRYLAHVPYEGLKCSDSDNEVAQAGARLCEKIGHVEHRPANPGLPESEYNFAFEGTSRSNLNSGDTNLVFALDEWMNDSDPGNVAGVLHRRRCLDPPLGHVGFGRSTKYNAMYCPDKSNKNVPDFSFIAFPDHGYMPIEYYPENTLWTVAVNPEKCRLSDAALTQVKVRQFGPLLEPIGEEIKLQDFHIDLTTGAPLNNCIVFRPIKIEPAPGKRFHVAIEGLRTKEGRPTRISYFVDFVKLTETGHRPDSLNGQQEGAGGRTRVFQVPVER